MSNILVISDDQFETEVLQSDLPVLAYFWAAWCGPCRLVSPSIEAMAQNYGDRLKIVKLEVDANPLSVKQYKIEGVPAIRLFKSGWIVFEHEGAINKEKLNALIAPHLEAPTDE